MNHLRQQLLKLLSDTEQAVAEAKSIIAESGDDRNACSQAAWMRNEMQRMQLRIATLLEGDTLAAESHDLT